MNKIIVLFLGILITYSCSDTEDGKWDDNIRLSQKEVLFSSDINTAMITTEGKSWWVAEISMNGTSHDLNGIDTNSENFLIESAEFKVERKNATEIHIEMLINQTGSDRILIISLQAGNYYDGIKVTQAGD